MKIVCVGGGPAGLYSSMLIKKADPDHEVVVYERNPRDVVMGWGMGFWDDLLKALYETDFETARRLQQNAVPWRGQNLILAGEEVRVEGGGCGIDRGKLLGILIDRALEVGVEIRFEEPVTDIELLGGADVVIAADGVNSSTRRRTEDRFGTSYLSGRNKFVWLGTNKLFDPFTFGFERTDHGWILMHAYATDPHISTCIVECSPETWRGLGLDALPRNDSLRLLESIFDGVLDGHELLSQGDDTARLPWASFRTITNRHWWAGNTVLVGDAAHTAHFSIGSGVRLALQDAIALAQSLRAEKTPQLAFTAYEKRRRAEVSGAQRDAWFSSRWLEEIDRYADLPAAEFFALLRARRDPILAHVPPELYYRLYAAVERHPALRQLKSQLGARVRRSYGQLVRQAP